MVEELEKKSLVELDEKTKILRTSVESKPLFVVKKDGGFGYDSTDLAALKYRVQELGLDRLVYVTDLGQRNHFLAIFEAAQRAGWINNVQCDHVGFGLVLGPDKKRFRSRDGGTVKLVDLLDEARDRMVNDLNQRIQENRCPLKPDEVEETANKLGYSAVKFFDLKNSREKDYVFDYGLMLQSDGETAIYLMYSFARICSIERKVAEVVGKSSKEIVMANLGRFRLSRERPFEWELALAITKFADRFELCMEELKPHVMCRFAFDLSTAFAKFYSHHQLLVISEKNLTPEHGENWLTLIFATKIALRDSLTLLGIDLLEKI